MIKFKNEWFILNETAKANRLSPEETILLFAIREVEAGTKNNEFNKINVQNTSLAMQADSMANQIAKGDFIYQQYCKGNFPLLALEANEEPIPFVEFLGQHLMRNEGVRKDAQWIKDVQEKTIEIIIDLEKKDANSSNSKLGQNN